MNAREVMRRAFRETVGIPEGDYFRSDVFDAQLDALAEAGFVVVACPPGSRVVVSRESKPCDECAGTGNRFYEVAEGFCDCIGCGGSGVVEATTIHGLAEATDEDVAFYKSTVINRRTNEPVYALVALPEDGE